MPAAALNIDVLRAALAPFVSQVVSVNGVGESVEGSISYTSLAPQIMDAVRLVLAQIGGLAGLPFTYPQDPGIAMTRAGWFPWNQCMGGGNFRTITEADSLSAFYACASAGSYSLGVVATNDSSTGQIASSFRMALTSDRVHTGLDPDLDLLYRYQKHLEMNTVRVYVSHGTTAGGTATWDFYGGNGGDINDAATWDTSSPIASIDSATIGSGIEAVDLTLPANYRRGIMVRRQGFGTALGTADGWGLRIHGVSGLPDSGVTGFRVGTAITFGGQLLSTFVGANQLARQAEVFAESDVVVPCIWLNDASAGTGTGGWTTNYGTLISNIVSAGAVPLCLSPFRASHTGAALAALSALRDIVRTYASSNGHPYIDLWDFPNDDEMPEYWDGSHLTRVGFANFAQYMGRLITGRRTWRGIRRRALQGERTARINVTS